MFFHIKELQYHAKPEKPDPLFAKKLQEILGGQFGEISVALQYLFQGWSVRGNGKYKDLLMDTGAEELAHIEMLATMIARLLDGAPVGDLEKAAKDPVIGAILGGMNPQHAIVSGLGAMPADSVGNRWTADYIIASGNLLADFRANLNAESQGRLQAVRLYETTTDRGVKDMLSWLIARDTMHQNQWLAAIKELEAKENVVVPSTFPRNLEKREVSHVLFNFSRGNESATGRWAKGPSMDGEGVFQYVEHPQPLAKKPVLRPAPAYIHDTPPSVIQHPRDEILPPNLY
ncbi:manganese catalase family protein [Bacillus haynesii]|uniref:manganese catalase family protein n=2 Tax=Bacillus haynesii TaxID=1925021 RepID=UPI00227FB075|nr:manganese catalase family protein [Bacillus haynesii]MCY7753594.1 manganese catalase family protein [Bacillus haynesii]MCY7850187.1 manganese catalase family protein [Bacillus haynesii]MCY8000978.1 manganese catalase family protein [Bacillus haynesii]MCY8045796.1 manganese catalase family protein [Bacillus haynesii]MCY8080570.1 manganese catalase family protein [Bacillus haynesii]